MDRRRQAGVRKRVVVKVLYQALTRWYNRVQGTDPVLICAPTDKAAHNINGVTLHNAFKAQANHRLTSKKLSNDTFNTLAVKSMNLKVVIIDEISMAGASLFNYSAPKK